MKQKTYLIFLVGFFLLLGTIIIIASFRQEKEEFLNIYNARINEKIAAISDRKGATILYTKKNQVYVFWPIKGKMNNYTFFEDVAAPNDSVLKSAQSDTIKLIHNEKIYLYHLKKL